MSSNAHLIDPRALGRGAGWCATANRDRNRSGSVMLRCFRLSGGQSLIGVTVGESNETAATTFPDTAADAAGSRGRAGLRCPIQDRYRPRLIQFRISHLGYSWLVGRFNGFNGQFSFDAAAPETTRITVDIDPASIDTNYSERDIHLRSKDFLAVTDYQDARFESDSVTVTGADTAQVRGRLTLRGVTKDIVIAAPRIGEGSDPWGGHRAGFYGTTTLTLADFGIPTTLGPAAATVDLMLGIEGIRQ